MRVLVPLGKGFEELEAISVIDVLRRVGCEVVIAAVDLESQKNLIVESQGGVKMVAMVKIADVQNEAFDGIVLPGGMEGTQNLIASKEVGVLLSALNARGKIIAAICAAPLALFKHKILTTQKFTCYPSIESQIENPNHCNSNVVRDGNLITSKGPATALEFAFYLASVFKGEQQSKTIQTNMLAVC